MGNVGVIISICLDIAVNLQDLWYDTFAGDFSDQTVEKLRVKENSFLSKIIPFKIGPLIDKKGQEYSYRICLKTSAIPYFVSLIASFIIIPISIIDMFIDFIPDIYFLIAGVLIVVIMLLRGAILRICSQVLHL